MYTLVVVKLKPAITATTASNTYVSPTNSGADYVFTPADTTSGEPATFSMWVARPVTGKIDLVLRVNSEFTSVGQPGDSSSVQPVLKTNAAGADFWHDGTDPNDAWYQVELKGLSVDISEET